MIGKNNDILDALSEAIEKTIDHFIDRDVYYYIAPYLSRREIDLACPFFRDNRISVKEQGNIDSLALKTIAYLAPFQRNRVAYNPKFIDYYLQTILHLPLGESSMEILCFEDGKCGEDNSYITYDKWIALP